MLQDGMTDMAFETITVTYEASITKLYDELETLKVQNDELRIRINKLEADKSNLRYVDIKQSSWYGDVDRQGGSFTDQEINDANTWR